MSDQTSPFRTSAYAKLNLALEVGAPVDAPGTSTHGYHPICSAMRSIDLHDVIEIERLGAGQPSRFDIAWLDDSGSRREVGWAIEEDLVWRAHKALVRSTGHPLPCAITVHKSIPAGGGLGGGSSDAASVLMGLDAVFGLGLGPAGLLPVAMTLGSDIGFFLDDRCRDGGTPPRPAVVSGFGETIERVDPAVHGAEVTLIVPPFGCPTGAVYGAFDAFEPRTIDPALVRRVFLVDELADEQISNALTRAACAAEPRLGVLLERLNASLNSVVHMTGSGSTLFVLGRIAAREIHEVAPDCRVVSTRLV